jgi:hypothetical protein
MARELHEGGKRVLFKPPAKEPRPQEKQKESPEKSTVPRKRMRTTIELSALSLEIIQEMQRRHRLETGRVLPLWKLIDQAIQGLGKLKI